MLREFLDGKRKTYYKPVAFFVLMTVVYLVIKGFTGFDPLTESSIQVDDTGNTLLSEARQFMFTNLTKLLFVFVFWMGLLLKLFFYKRYSLAEFWTIAFYLAGVYIIFTTLYMFFVQLVGTQFKFAAMLTIAIYFMYVFVSLFKTPIWLIISKGIPICILAFFLYTLTAFSLSYLIVSIF